MTIFKQARFKRFTLITSLSLTLVFLSQSSCNSGPSRENINSNVNVEQAKVHASPSEAAKSMSQDPLADNLILVMKDWSRQEIARLERSSPLSNMWTLNHAPSTPYDPQGIEKLIGKIRDNPFFKNTPRIKDRAHELNHGFFVTGGGIQNQGQLYDFLGS